jgi:uncharacterized OB-fold protein
MTATRKCGSCGATNVGAMDRCMLCGAPLEVPAPTEAEALEAFAEAAACRNCGAVLKEDAQFCTACGTPTAAPDTCSSCGAELRPGKAFCASCGARVG